MLHLYYSVGTRVCIDSTNKGVNRLKESLLIYVTSATLLFLLCVCVCVFTYYIVGVNLA